MTATAMIRSQDIQTYEGLSYSASSTSTSDLLPPSETSVSGQMGSRPRHTTTLDLSPALYGEITSLPVANLSDFLSSRVYWTFASQPSQLVNVFLSKARLPSQVSFDVRMTGEHVAVVFIPEIVVQKEISAVVELVPAPRSWIELAAQAFPGSRNMTREERAELNALRAPITKPLSKPLKKLPPR